MTWMRFSQGRQNHFCENTEPGPFGLTYWLPICGSAKGLRANAAYSGKQLTIPKCRRCEQALSTRANQGGANE